MVNRSKINNPRYWAIWKAAGAVATIESPQEKAEGKVDEEFDEEFKDLSPYHAQQKLDEVPKSKLKGLLRIILTDRFLGPENNDPHKWQNLGYYAYTTLSHPKITKEHYGMIVEAIVKSQSAFSAVQVLFNPKITKEFHPILIDVIENYVNSPMNHDENKAQGRAHSAYAALEVNGLKQSLRKRLINMIESSGSEFYIEKLKASGMDKSEDSGVKVGEEEDFRLSFKDPE